MIMNEQFGTISGYKSNEIPMDFWAIKDSPNIICNI